MKKILTSLVVATLLLSMSGVVNVADSKENWDESVYQVSNKQPNIRST